MSGAVRSLFVSGPVTGHLDLNRPAFEEARVRLLDRGYRVVVPADVVPPDARWEDAMRATIGRMLRCDGVAYLPGWRDSKGASIEVHLARTVGMPAMSVRDWEEHRYGR